MSAETEFDFFNYYDAPETNVSSKCKWCSESGQNLRQLVNSWTLGFHFSPKFMFISLKITVKRNNI